MRKMTLLAVMMTAMLCCPTTGAAEVDENFYIYLCFGQSNMEGQATIEDCDLTPDARFQMMSTLDCGTRRLGEWYRAVPPLARCTTNLGPADYFGRTMVAHLDEGKRVGVVVVAIGGVAIDLYDPDGWQANVASMTESWQKSAVDAYGGNPLGRLMDCARKAQESGVIKGILLHQGETDAYSTQWLEKVKKIYNYMLSELNLKAADVPLLAGEVGHADQKGICAGANTTIDKLPQYVPTAHVVSSKGCTLMSDNLHFDSAGQRKLGRRYAKEALSVLGIEADIDEDEVPQADVNEPVDLTNRFAGLWNNAESVTAGDGATLVYKAVKWGGLAAWLGSEDWSAYEKIVFEFAEPTPMATQLLMMRGNGATLYEQASMKALRLEMSFADKDVTDVTQVALQASADGTIRISKIYLVRKGASGIEQPENDRRNGKMLRAYNLKGQPLGAEGHKGIVVSDGKKNIR